MLGGQFGQMKLEVREDKFGIFTSGFGGVN